MKWAIFFYLHLSLIVLSEFFEMKILSEVNMDFVVSKHAL